MLSAGQKRPRSCSVGENDDNHINKDDDKDSGNLTSPHPCLSFLTSASTTDNSHPFSVRNSDSKTFGTILIANRDIPPHSLLFRLPSQFLVTHDAVCATELSQLIRESVQQLNSSVKTSVLSNSSSGAGSCSAHLNDGNKNDNNNKINDIKDNDDNNNRQTQQLQLQISPEELTWINMVYWRVSPEQTSHQIYLKSLSAVPPNVSAWSKFLQDCLIGTNVYAVLDESANNHHDDGDVDHHQQHVVDGNVSVVKALLKKLDRIRSVVGKGRLMTDQQSQQSQVMNDTPTTNSKHASQWTDATLQILQDDSETSIFTLESLGWARGHFLSRRFPATMKNLGGNNKNNKNKALDVQSTGMDHNNNNDDDKHASNSSSDSPNHHLAGYGNANSMFIPILDLMNHTPVRTNACSIEVTDDGRYLQVFTGDSPLQQGDELYYCYSSAAETGGLSNEILLQGYGFCLEDNPADTVSVKISTMGDDEAHSHQSGNAFWIGRGGVSAIPSAMWRALAGSTKAFQGDVDDESKTDDDPIEIGSGDLDLLLQYMTNKLVLLNGEPKTKQVAFHTTETDMERLAYIEMYKNGQREILVELIKDLTLMLEGYNCE